SMQCTHIPPTF
nr:immunoglobulin light chain junction region [Macaca mulatta]MOX54121.1 immunoglobulin light chain junction region [Macaca mulatta]